MNSSFHLAVLVGSLALLWGPASSARTEELPAEQRAAVKKGLEWLARQQDRNGYWEAAGGQYPVTMTALSGMALLMEGSTLHSGKYQVHLRRAADWLMSCAGPNGLIGAPGIPGEAGRYMYSHGYATLFLACVLGEEEDKDRRRALHQILTQAAQFSRAAQTHRGGWGYVTAKEGNQFDEGSVAVTQMQALCACRNAGIEVPPEAIPSGMAYLKAATNTHGGVIYSLGGGGGGDGRPGITTTAIVCAFSAGEASSPLVKKWLQFSQEYVPSLGGDRFGYDEYTHYYLAQAAYMLGEDGYEKLFPAAPAKDRLTWSKYKKDNFGHLIRTQASDGSWPPPHIGSVYNTALFLCILQLDNAALPVYRRLDSSGLP